MRARRIRITLLSLVSVALPLAAWLVLPVLSAGSPQAEQASLQKRIEQKQRQVERNRERDRALSADVDRYAGKVDRLQGQVDGLQAREDVIQADLDVEQAQLAQVQKELRDARARLVRLRSRLAASRRVLAARLVDLYQSEDPDIVTVILSADGFADLLERSEFINRVSEQDRSIITRVKRDKAETQRATKRLARLEDHQHEITARVRQRRNAVAAIRLTVSARRDDVAEVRDGKRAVLSHVRDERSDAMEDIAAMEREQASIQAKLAGGSPGGPIRHGSGDLIWPANAPVTSPFGMRWGRLHAGIDMGMPVGTQIHAAASGTVKIAGWVGGYGNYTCIQHAGPLSTCYGHQSSIGVSVGQHVSQGQVIGLSGNTGNSTGPHLHFETRINGNPQDPMGYL